MATIYIYEDTNLLKELNKEDTEKNDKKFKKMFKRLLKEMEDKKRKSAPIGD